MARKKNKKIGGKVPSVGQANAHKVHGGRQKPRQNAARTGGERFILEDKMGSGGLCDVYSALDLLRLECGDSITKVAVKRLQAQYAENAAARRLLAREFFALRCLPHPGVVRVFDLHKCADGLYMSMELLGGRNLHEELATRPAGYGKAGQNMLGNLFATLTFMHGMHLVHGDIKPANIMQEKSGRTVLIDFSTAEAVPEHGQASSALSQGLYQELKVHAFSSIHASPERLAGTLPSRADDIYAACCSAYEIVEGQHPFKRKSALEAQQQKMRPEKMRALGGKPGKMIERGLSFDPAERPSAREFFMLFNNRGSQFERLFNL